MGQEVRGKRVFRREEAVGREHRRRLGEPRFREGVGVGGWGAGLEPDAAHGAVHLGRGTGGVVEHGELVLGGGEIGLAPAAADELLLHGRCRIAGDEGAHVGKRPASRGGAARKVKVHSGVGDGP